MSIIATNQGSNAPLMEAGNFIARCYSMTHLGTAEEVFMDEVKQLNKVRIGWEFPTELKVFKEGDAEKPFVISKEFTLSMNEKANLRKMLESWRGKSFTDDEAKSFDITKLLGVTCMLNVIHKTTKAGKTYSDIGSVSPIPKGMECPPQFNPMFEFNFGDNFDENVLEKFPDFIKDRIKKSNEFNAMFSPNAIETPSSHKEETQDDGLPF